MILWNERHKIIYYFLYRVASWLRMLAVTARLHGISATQNTGSLLPGTHLFLGIVTSTLYCAFREYTDHRCISVIACI